MDRFRDHSAPGACAPSKRRGALLALLCAGVVGLGGCEMLGLSDPQPSQPPAQKPAGGQANKAGGPAKPGDAPGGPGGPPGQAAGQEAEAEEEETEYQRPDYPENTRRNPFQPVPEVVAPEQAVAAEEEEARPVEPLERFSLSELELVAVISETAVPKAMFIDPDSFGHVVKEGDRIGRQGGTITDIRDNEVDVQETTGQEDAAKSSVRTIRLRQVDLQGGSEDSEELSEAEREALERLLQSEEGRQQLRRSLRDRSAPSSDAEPQGARRARGIEPPPR